MSKPAVNHIVIATLIVLSFTSNTYAGYVVKNGKVIQHTQASILGINKIQNKLIDVQYTKAIKEKGEENENQQTRNKKRSRSGWEGTASMYCAIFGLLVFPPGLIASIILGGLGLGDGKKHRGRAIAGLIIGITSVFLIATLLVLSAT